MVDIKALKLLKKYYLPYENAAKPSKAEKEKAIKSGVLVPDSIMTHDEIVTAIKELSERISLESAAKAFLYSLSSSDIRYRTAVSSLVWARSLPEHKAVSNDVKKNGLKVTSCMICGCSHGLEASENIDWNEYGVFRYLSPKQYGKEPDFTCAEYVLNDLREFEKLPAVEPCEDDYGILNTIFSCVGQITPNNMDVALIEEIRRKNFIDTTCKGIHCILGVLSICGILESTVHKGFLHSFTDSDKIGGYRDDISFYPLYYWRGKDGVNYDAVKEIFGSFSGGKLSPECVPVSENKEKVYPKKAVSKAQQYYTDGVYTIMLTNEERRYLTLDPVDPDWEPVSMYSVTYLTKKRTVLFYKDNTIVKVIYEELSVNEDGSYNWKNYTEFDTCLETDNRSMLLPLTSKGRVKNVTPTNVMAVRPSGGYLRICLKQGESQITAQNMRNSQTMLTGETERIKNIMSDEDFHEFMKEYISVCPDQE